MDVKRKVIGCTLLMMLAGMDVVRAAESTIVLPQPQMQGSMSLEQAIAQRRSQRSFSQQELTNKQLGQLLWAGQGITSREGGFGWRATPSAGALYPLEIYAVTAGGTYHYLPETHALELFRPGDRRGQLQAAALGQPAVGDAACAFVICAVYSRMMPKYGERGRQLAILEAGHVGQNMHLQAVALGLGSVSIGAFDDTQVGAALEIPADQTPLYIIPAGYVQ